MTAILGITVAAILSNGGRAELTTVHRDACLLLAVPAIASALSLLVLGTIARARRSTQLLGVTRLRRIYDGESVLLRR